MIKTPLLQSVGTALFAGAMLFPQTGTQANEQSFMTPTTTVAADLAHEMRRAGAGDLISVTILMREQVPAAQIDAIASMGDKDARRAAMIDALKKEAAASQGGLMRRLERAQANGTVGANLRPLWIANIIVADLSPRVIREVAARDDVARITFNRSANPEDVLLASAASPRAASKSPGSSGAVACGVELLGADDVWADFGVDGGGVLVAVIDTGCCLTHPDLAANVWVNPGEIPGNGVDDDANGYIDDINGWNTADDNHELGDIFNHGAPVTGIVCGDGTNGVTTGIAPGAQFMTVRWTGGTIVAPSVWEGIQYAVDNGADIINASVGWPHNDNEDLPVWRMVSENAIAAGVVVCAAAGNSGTCCPPAGAINAPGDVPSMITAGAVDCADEITVFSSRGPTAWSDVDPYNDWPHPPGKKKPTIMGVGGGVGSTDRDCGSYTEFGGTSAASPHAAGTAALLLAVNPALDHHGVKQIIIETAVDLGDAGWDNEYGAGRIDAYAAVAMALDQIGSSAAGLERVTVVKGDHLSGTPDDLSLSDDEPVHARSGFGATFIDLHHMEMHVAARTTVLNPQSLNLTIKSRISEPAGTAQLRLRNQVTGDFEQVGQYPLGDVDSIDRIEDIAAADHVGAAGAIELSIKHTVFVPFFAFRFESFVDQVEILIDS